MIALVQRVSEATVSVSGEVIGSVGVGLLILVGIHLEDGDREISWVARKCANLRVFPDQQGKMNLSLKEVRGEALVVSQFTLYGQVGKGNRPSYNAAAAPDDARPVFDQFVESLESELERPVETGLFGAKMDVQLVNDGPVTVWVEKAPAARPQIRSDPS
jgi:D-tyrosyl-tRNA(Tyr) deacylase